ncbi:hypothetical protein KCP75_08845 [Salmonella enterica subsp. enterica]|nr:hypothetical protein KCP75_08845 [Salmonella enterica subsp. enterica]
MSVAALKLLKIMMRQRRACACCYHCLQSWVMKLVRLVMQPPAYGDTGADDESGC